MSEQLLAALLGWAVTLSGYAPPGKLPSIHYLGEEEFVGVVCKGNTMCTALGTYADGTGVLTLHDSLRGKADLPTRAVVVHELVHYLQDKSGRWTEASCENWVRREREAYHVQTMYVQHSGNRAPAQAPVLTTRMCDKAHPSAAHAKRLETG